MKYSSKAFFASIAYVSMLGFAIPANADVLYSPSKLDKQYASECISRWDTKNTCDRVKKDITRSYNYFRTKGRNRGSNNKWEMRKSTYLLNKFNRNKTPKKKQTFFRPLKGGLRIDVCVQGTGWKSSDANRCDQKRLQKIGANFCRSVRMKRAVKIQKEPHRGNHAVLTYNKSRPKNSYWKRQKGKLVIKKIVCE